MRILLVEDDVAITRSLKEGLEDEAYAVDVAHDGDEGYRTARRYAKMVIRRQF